MSTGTQDIEYLRVNSLNWYSITPVPGHVVDHQVALPLIKKGRLQAYMGLFIIWITAKGLSEYAQVPIQISLPENLVSRVQTIQNSCAKCLTRVNRFATATEARITLHWLPSRARSRFKILVFAHKVVHLPNSVPRLISAPFSTRDHGRTTRFNVSNTLKCDFKRRLLTVGGRSLNHTLPSVWNSLPQELRDIQSFMFIQVIPQ